MTPICPLCDVVLTVTDFEHVRECPQCKSVVHATRWKHRAVKSEVRTKTDARTAAQWFELEAQLVEAVRKELTGRGYIFTRLNQRRADKSGSDAGSPDALVELPGCPIALCMEVKLPNSPEASGEEQKKALRDGRRVRVESVEQAVTAAQWLKNAVVCNVATDVHEVVR